jgi:hypothetical protein
MLYKFKSKAAADLVMLEINGRRILEIMGKADSLHQGIVLPADMRSAIQALETAVVEQEEQRKHLSEQAKSQGETPPRFDEVSLRQRAAPMIEMLRRCEKADQDMVWGV